MQPEKEADTKRRVAQLVSITIHCIMLRENTAKPFNFEHIEYITLGKSTKQNNSSYQRELSEAELDINKSVHRDQRQAPGYLATTNLSSYCRHS